MAKVFTDPKWAKNHARKLDAPVITVIGKEIDLKTGQVNSSKSELEIDHSESFNRYSKKGKQLKKNELPTFYKGEGAAISVTLDIPETGWFTGNKRNISSAKYTQVQQGSIFVGKHKAEIGPNGVIANANAEVYYTINGKNPSRTKSNLYKGTFDLDIKTLNIARDHVTIKAKIYWWGQESETIKAKIRIVDQS